MFINKLILHRTNVRDLLDAGGVRILVDLLTLAHLHTSRAVIPAQTNVIEAGPNVQIVQEKEWYYNTEETGRNGPVSFQEVSTPLYLISSRSRWNNFRNFRPIPSNQTRESRGRLILQHT